MTWKHGKRWVYSITYDEGCADLLKFALPLHRGYAIPGHVALVAKTGHPVNEIVIFSSNARVSTRRTEGKRADPRRSG